MMYILLFDLSPIKQITIKQIKDPLLPTS